MSFFSENKKQSLTVYEKKLLSFYCLGFFCESSKAIIYYIVFHFLGFQKEYVIALLLMATLRISGGGLHFKNYFSCLLVSFIFLSLAILGGLILYIPLPVMIFLCMMCLITAYKLVPIQAPTRPGASEQLINSAKSHTAVKIILITVFICLFHNNIYGNIGFWTLIIHVVQLTIAKKWRK